MFSGGMNYTTRVVFLSLILTLSLGAQAAEAETPADVAPPSPAESEVDLLFHGHVPLGTGKFRTSPVADRRKVAEARWISQIVARRKMRAGGREL